MSARLSNRALLIIVLVIFAFFGVLLPQIYSKSRSPGPINPRLRKSPAAEAAPIDDGPGAEVLEEEEEEADEPDPLEELNLETASRSQLVAEIQRLRTKAPGSRALSPTDTMREAVFEEFDVDASNASDTTLVTALFDLGRGDEKMQGFKRPFTEYVERFKRVLSLGFPTVIFMPREIFEKYFKEEVKKLPSYHIMFKTNEELRAEFKYYDLVQKIRKKPGWADQAGWLPDSPQAKLPLYNPLVMSKVYWLGEVAKLNPLNTKYFLWLDGGHLCAPGLMPHRMGVFKQYMSTRFLVTHFPYLPNTEIHGFEHEAFDRMLGVSLEDDLERHHVRVVRGGVFGGKLNAIGPVVELYDYWLKKSLTEGFMGTEENIFSLALYSHPELFHAWDNGGGDFCSIFSRAKAECSRAYPLKWKLENEQ